MAEEKDTKIPQGFIRTVRHKIVDEFSDWTNEEAISAIQKGRYSDVGKLLKACFMLGPSKAVEKAGKVIAIPCDIDGIRKNDAEVEFGVSDDQDLENDIGDAVEKQYDDINAAKKNLDKKHNSKKESINTDNIIYSYSILENYYRLHRTIENNKIYEDLADIAKQASKIKIDDKDSAAAKIQEDQKLENEVIEILKKSDIEYDDNTIKELLNALEKNNSSIIKGFDEESKTEINSTEYFKHYLFNTIKKLSAGDGKTEKDSDKKLKGKKDAIIKNILDEAGDKLDEREKERLDAKERELNDSENKEIARDKKEKDAESDEQTKEFQPGMHIFVISLLPNEGCTKWHLIVDERNEDKIDSIKAALQSKKFKNAYNIASQGLQSDGLVVISMMTYVNSKPPINVPFLGKCRYAINAGSTDGNDENNTITLAIAPINGATKKTNPECIFTAKYEVTGDFTGGKLSEFLMGLSGKARDKADGDDSRSYRRRDNDDENADSKAADAIDKYLNARFRSPGDDSMYSEFVKIREFLAKSIKEQTLEYNVADSVSPKEFVKAPVLKKMLICY